MSCSLIVIGAGGHAKVLLEALLRDGQSVDGLTDADVAKVGTNILGIPVLGDDRKIRELAPDSVRLVNGVGTVRVAVLRRQVYENFRQSGYRFEQVVHPSAVVAADVVLGEGVQIMAGAVLQPGCQVGENAIINTRATVDHDCIIGCHAHISPGVVLCGNVVIGDGSHIGAGATVIQGVSIGRACMVAAGAVVLRNLSDGVTVAGVPAKELIHE